MTVVIDIRVGVAFLYGIMGVLTPFLAAGRGRFSVGGTAVAALITVLLALLSIVGFREIGKNGMFLLFRRWTWCVVPHVAWAVGVAAGILNVWTSMPLG